MQAKLKEMQGAEAERRSAVKASGERGATVSTRRSRRLTEEERLAYRMDQEASARRRAARAAVRAAAGRAHVEQRLEMERLILHCERQVVDRHKAEADRVAKLRGRRDEEVRSAEVIRMLLNWQCNEAQRFPLMYGLLCSRAQLTAPQCLSVVRIRLIPCTSLRL